MKLAPIIHQLKNFNLNFKLRIIHTGQHYDKNLSSKLIEQLNLPKKIIRNEDFKVGKIPKKWDGKTAQRIIKVLNKIASNE